MDRNNNYRYIILIISVLFFTACKTSSFIINDKLKPIPSGYIDHVSTKDSLNINWSDFFQDPLLINLIDNALQNNPDLLMALQRIEITKAQLRHQKGLLLPTVDLGMGAGNHRISEYSADWAGNDGETYQSGKALKPIYNDLYLGFQSSWEADFWGKLKNKKKAAQMQYLSGVEGVNWIITALIAEVSNLYYDLLFTDHELTIIRNTIKLQERAFDIVQIKKETGKANMLAVNQFEAQLLNYKSTENEILQEITEIENQLNFILGRFPQTIERGETNLVDINNIASGVPSELVQNRPDIREAGLELKATKADVKAAKAAFYPSLTIEADMALSAYNFKYLFDPQSMTQRFVGNLAAPLINRSAIKADFAQATAKQMKAMYRYQKIIIEAFVEVSNELRKIERLKDMQALKEAEVSVLDKAVNNSTELFKTGNATYIEVLTAQQSALDAEIGLNNIYKQLQQAYVNLYRSLGGGWR